jgi:micrococcal nuclease
VRAAGISSGPLHTAPATVLLSLLLLACSTSSASAATCADFSSQADAQRAANTRDGDGDGVYCEALPCPCARPGSSSPPPPPTAEPRRRRATIRARITAVIDGDTIRVLTASRRRVTVRLIGIDTPETRKPGTPVECGGPEATANLRRLSFTGSQGRGVTLTSDPSQDRIDRFGRLLAYATTDARRDLAFEQLRAGYTPVYVFRRAFERLGAYRSAEGQARAAGRGAWGACGGDFHGQAGAASDRRVL